VSRPVTPANEHTPTTRTSPTISLPESSLCCSPARSFADCFGGGRVRTLPKSAAGRDRLYQRVTVPVAALAGPLTHNPGLFYLIALNVIVAHNPWLPDGLGAVLIYDVVWFAMPIAALAMCIVKPDAARAVVASTHRWTGKHAHSLIVVTSFVVGVALIVRGVLAL
jgi:Sap-like sulfolipid-1-addressing protein